MATDESELDLEALQLWVLLDDDADDDDDVDDELVSDGSFKTKHNDYLLSFRINFKILLQDLCIINRKNVTVDLFLKKRLITNINIKSDFKSVIAFVNRILSYA